MVSATQVVTWTAALTVGAILIAAMPGFAALVPLAVVGVIAEVRHQLVKTAATNGTRQ